MKKVVLWDWNGTLLDDVAFCSEIISSMLIERKRPPISREQYRQIFTFPVIEYYKALGFDFIKEDWETVAFEFINRYYANVFDHCLLRSHASSVLNELAQKGYKQYVVSAMEQTRLEELVAFYGVGSFFEQVKGIDDHYADGKINSAKQLKDRLGNGDYFFVGDTKHDEEVAQVFNARTFLLTDGHQTKERLLSEVDSILIDDLKALLQYL